MVLCTALGVVVDTVLGIVLDVTAAFAAHTAPHAQTVTTDCYCCYCYYCCCCYCHCCYDNSTTLHTDFS
jgi:hypothetical protein